MQHVEHRSWSLLVPILALVLAFSGAMVGRVQASGFFDLSYSGRITDDRGVPKSGPANLSVGFYRAEKTGKPILEPILFKNVALDEGVFQVTLRLESFSAHIIFNGNEQVWIGVDLDGVAYPRQLYLSTPYAMKVPIDRDYLSYDEEGRLTLVSSERSSSINPVLYSSGGNVAIPGSINLERSNKASGTFRFSNVGDLKIHFVDVTGAPEIVRFNKNGSMSLVGQLTTPSIITNTIFGQVFESNETKLLSRISDPLAPANAARKAITLQAPDDMTDHAKYVFPASPVTNRYLRTDANGILSWAAPVLDESPTFTGSVTLPGTSIWNSSGSVGIGNMSPASKLDVTGDIGLSMDNSAIKFTGKRTIQTGSYDFGSVSQLYFPDSAFNPDGSKYVTAGSIRLKAQMLTWLAPVNVEGAELFLEGGKSPEGGVDPGSAVIKTAGTERLRVSGDGRVGIGTATPSSALEVNGTITATEVVGKVTASEVTSTQGVYSAGGFQFSDDGISDSTAVRFFNNAGSLYLQNGLGDEIHFRGKSGLTNMIIKDGGDVGIGTLNPTYKLHVVGTAGLSTGTAWTNASDARLKDIHGNYEYGLDEVLKLRTVRFNYKKNNPLGLPSSKSLTGFIAQEVERIIPDAVHMNKNGYRELNVDPIHWAVVNAIQELYTMIFGEQGEISALKAEIAALKQENDAIQVQHSQFKDYICTKDPESIFCDKK